MNGCLGAEPSHGVDRGQAGDAVGTIGRVVKASVVVWLEGL